MKDGSATLRFSTQEIVPADLVIIKEFHGHFGKLLFSEDEIQPTDVPKADNDFEGKSPSKRLRNVIFVVWKTRKDAGKTELKFEDFYAGQIENIIEQYKEKLPER